MNVFGAPGTLTSGRRTYRGNRLVGGVSNSHHLDGSAGDFTGTTAAALRQYFGANAHIIPEADHLHVQGMPAGTFPYYGKQGIAGLVNGVDTTAPQGVAAVAPKKKPMTLADIAAPNLNADVPVALGGAGALPMPAMSLGDLANPAPVKGHNTGKTLGTIAGILGDALMAYGGLAPQFGPNLARQQEDERNRDFDREQFNERLQLERDKALEPPTWLANAMAYDQLPDPQKQVVNNYQNVMNPIVADVQNPDGSVVRRIMPRQLTPRAGHVEDGYVFLGGDPADPKNWKAQ